MEMAPVDSSHIVATGYDSLSQTLHVEFKGGAVYRYFLVPAEVYRDFLEAESKGKFFSANIRFAGYTFEKD
jgi:hypothetical protein